MPNFNVEKVSEWNCSWVIPAPHCTLLLVPVVIQDRRWRFAVPSLWSDRMGRKDEVGSSGVRGPTRCGGSRWCFLTTVLAVAELTQAHQRTLGLRLIRLRLA